MGDNGTFLISLSPILNFHLWGRFQTEKKCGSHIIYFFILKIFYNSFRKENKFVGQNVVDTKLFPILKPSLMFLI